ncbi:MAG: hypothetical protein ACTSQ1_01360 [Promethearchaeota archaeon]
MKKNNKNPINNEVSKSKKSFVKPKKDYSFLEEDKYIKKWLIGVKNQRGRLSVIEKYCDYTDMMPEELIKEHQEDMRKDVIEREDITKKRIKGFFHYLVGEINEYNDKKIRKPISWNSARQYAFSKISSFYKRVGIPVLFNKREIPEQKKGVNENTWRNGDDNERITIEHKKKWLKKIFDDFSSKKNKAIFLCKISSGMDSIDLFNLKKKDFDNGYVEELNLSYIDGTRAKSKMSFQTFFSSEACDQIRLYFKDRERKGEKLTSKSWLFVVDKGIERDGIKTYSKMKSTLFYDDLKESCLRLDLKNITPKSLRRWFSSTAKKKPIDGDGISIIERMMGHKEKISDVYNQMLKDAKEDQEFLEYAEWYHDNVEPKIQIIGRSTNEREVKKEIVILQEENLDLKMKITGLEDRLNETIDRLTKIHYEMVINLPNMFNPNEKTPIKDNKENISKPKKKKKEKSESDKIEDKINEIKKQIWKLGIDNESIHKQKNQGKITKEECDRITKRQIDHVEELSKKKNLLMEEFLNSIK